MTTALRSFLLCVAAFVGFSIARGDRRVIAYLVVVGVIGAGVALAHRRRPLSPAQAWGLAACGALHLAGGLLPGDPVFYETWIVPHVVKFDQLVHFSVTGIVTAVLIARAEGRCGRAMLLAMAAGFGNELFEYLSALRYADAFVGDFSNARWDVVFNLFGALTAACLSGEGAGVGVRWFLPAGRGPVRRSSA